MVSYLSSRARERATTHLSSRAREPPTCHPERGSHPPVIPSEGACDRVEGSRLALPETPRSLHSARKLAAVGMTEGCLARGVYPERSRRGRDDRGGTLAEFTLSPF